MLCCSAVVFAGLTPLALTMPNEKFISFEMVKWASFLFSPNDRQKAFFFRSFRVFYFFPTAFVVFMKKFECYFRCDVVIILPTTISDRPATSSVFFILSSFSIFLRARPRRMHIVSVVPLFHRFRSLNLHNETGVVYYFDTSLNIVVRRQRSHFVDVRYVKRSTFFFSFIWTAIEMNWKERREICLCTFALQEYEEKWFSKAEPEKAIRNE